MMPQNQAQWALMMQIEQIQHMRETIQQQLQQGGHLQGLQCGHLQAYGNNNDEDNEIEDEKDDEKERTLFIANLDERIDEEILFELFLQAGPLESVRLPKQRSFAFVIYQHSCSIPYAMHLYQGLMLYGKPLVIKFNNKNVAPPLTRRLLPPDWGLIKRNPETKRHSYDNSSLRNPNFNPFRNDDEARCNRNSQSANSHGKRERKSPDVSPTGKRYDKDWLHGSSHGQRNHSHHNRHSEREHGRRSNEHDRHYSKHGSNRRSEKRDRNYI